MGFGSCLGLAGLVVVLGGGHAPAAEASRPHAGVVPTAAKTAGATSAARPDSIAAPADSSRAWAFADTVRGRVASMRRLEGHAAAGGTTSIWNAYFDGGEVRYVTEDLAQEEFGTRHNEYFFVGEHLRVFTSRGPRSLTGPAAERGPYELRIAFDAQDAPIASEKRVSGKSQALEDPEAQGAQARAAWLHELARRAALPPKQ